MKERKVLKTLRGCVGEYRKSTILTPVFVTLEVICDILIPLIMADLIDKGVEAGDMGNVFRYGGILLVAALASLVFGMMAGRFAAVASSGFARNMRRNMYKNVQKFSFSNIDRFSTAGLVTRLTTDVTNVQFAYQMIIRSVFRAPLMIIFALITAFGINAELSVIYLVCIPIMGVGLFFIVRKVHPIFEKVFRTYDKLNNVVQENLRGIRVVKTFIREDHEEQKFKGVSEDIRKTFTKAEKLMALNMPLMQFCLYGSVILIAWIGARLIIASGNNPDLGMTTGLLMTMFTYAVQILMNMMMLSMVFAMITMAQASAERITEVICEKSDIVSPENALEEVPSGDIRFEDVSFSYSGEGGRMCLKDIDLDIKAGETVGILGGTGSSKSTLVQLIPRLYDVTKGAVYVGGQDVRNYDLEVLRNAVAMVLQKNELFSGTIKENLRWGDEHATDEELVHACRLAQADEFIQGFPDGYDTYIEQGGANVSGGQKQRLCIARALLKHPKILVLDDSTSAVDTRTDALIRKAFREDLPDTTKIIIAQRVSSVQEADKILVMDNGVIVAMGTHEELLKNSEIYREVYTSQVKGGEEDA